MTAVPQTPPPVEIERVVSPTPSAKARFSALQRMKKLGAKFKKSKKVDDIPENSAPVEALPAAVEVAEEQEEQNALAEQLDVPELPEPTTLAQRIRALITSLPTNGPEHPPIKTGPPPLDSDGCPIPPPGAIHVKDPKLIQFLSDPEIMNGSIDDGRTSVWEALEALAAPNYRKPTSSDDTPGESDGEPGDDDVQSQGDVMLYCPLVPTDHSKVELANQKITEVPITTLDTFWQSRLNFLWSVTVGLVKSQPPQTKLVKTWVPSTTKISFQAMWYLPPPVMTSLSSDEAEAVKIAGTITAALTWFLGNVSPSSVPAPLLPAFFLLQKLGPYAGYIGTFIAWIWGAVKNADQGNGVVLTATWVLPVALIPAAIKAPETPTAPSDTPATAPSDTPATAPPTTTPIGAPPTVPANASSTPSGASPTASASGPTPTTSS
ncbi:hypothetical protein C8R44DRAFT_990035 [Mycena epipterygia]|nr:hypothetical protein C8R44DRAFT_990035 [Mycena epipterygia]